MNPTSQHITIIGAGLCGSLLASFLARWGHTVTVFERRPDMRREDISGGRSINLALAHRGIYALEQAGLMDDIESNLIPMRGRMLHEEGGKPVFQPYGARPHEVIYSLSRGELNKILMTGAERTRRVAFHFSERCVGADLDGKNLRLEDAQGAQRSHPYDIVIGTDGSASVLRQAISKASGVPFVEERLDHSYKELTIPPTEQGKFRLEREALHVWPRGDYMLIALPNTGGSFTVTLFLPTEGPVSFASLHERGAVCAFFDQNFPDVVPLMPTLVDDFFGHPTGRLATVRSRRWHHKGEALILGDAAHAVVPFHGQGMNCAFEDCTILDDCLETHGDDWAAAFAELERERLPNANAIADLALENYLVMRNQVRDPRFHLKKALAWRLEQDHPEHFIPRYSMVMFHSIPYAEAKRLGVIQEEILETLTEGITQIEQVDYPLAHRLIVERLEG